jgi:hypothetical protein
MVRRASGLDFMFCPTGLVFGGTEGVGSRFHILRAQTCFRRYRERRFSFSCFPAMSRAWGLVFMFCAPGPVFGGTEGVGSLFHVLHAQIHFRRNRGRRLPFSCFAFPDSFSTVQRVPGPVFMFCGPGLVFGGTEGIGSHFHVLRSLTRFRQYGGRLGSISCFAQPDSFSAVPRASGSVFIFCVPGLISGGTEGDRSRFHVLRPRTRFRGYRGRRSPFHVLRAQTNFRRYRGRQVPYSCFALSGSFSVVPRASGPVSMFCAPGHVFGDTDGVGSRFHVLHVRTCFQRN